MWKNDYESLMSEAEKLVKIHPDRRTVYLLAWLGSFQVQFGLSWPSGLEMKPDELVMNLTSQLQEAEQHDRLARDFQRRANSGNRSESRFYSLLAKIHKKRAGELRRAQTTWGARAGRVLGPEEEKR